MIQESIDEVIARLSMDPLYCGDIPFPCDADTDIDKIIDAFLQLNLVSRTKFLEKFKTRNILNSLLTFSYRMAIMAVREKNSGHIFKGLIAIVVRDMRIDSREDTTFLRLLWHSALKLKVNPVELFDKAASYATPKTANFIKGYTDPRFMSINYTGFKEGFKHWGFWYVFR